MSRTWRADDREVRSASPIIDETAFVAPSAIVEGEVSIGSHASVWHQSVLRGDSDRIVIGSSTNVQDGAIIHADPGFPCIVGEAVTVGHRAVLHGCIVEGGTLVGIGALILNGARLGMGSVVAAGAVVTEGMDVPAGTLVAGVPARIVGEVSQSLAARATAGSLHYVELASRRLPSGGLMESTARERKV
jgi:carbonic anhydrase/acetyltransferase-like protein (isoleucine patch superfamily)